MRGHLNQLLAPVDGFEPNEAVMVLAVTTRPDGLDPALLQSWPNDVSPISNTSMAEYWVRRSWLPSGLLQHLFCRGCLDHDSQGSRWLGPGSAALLMKANEASPGSVLRREFRYTCGDDL